MNAEMIQVKINTFHFTTSAPEGSVSIQARCVQLGRGDAFYLFQICETLIIKTPTQAHEKAQCLVALQN